MNVAVTRAAEGFDRRSFTVHDVRRMIDTGIMDEDERVELVEGELVVMAAKGYAHDLIKNGLNLALARALPPDMMVGIENSIQFTDNSILEPDLVVFKRSARSVRCRLRLLRARQSAPGHRSRGLEPEL